MGAIKSIFKPVLDSVFSGADSPSGPGQLCYSPRTASYDAANYTSVSLTGSGTVIANVTALTNSSTIQYLIGSSGSASVYYRGSDGRLRITSDAGEIAQVNTSIPADGQEHEIQIDFTSSNVDFFVDGNFVGSVSGTFTDFTSDCIGARNNTGSLSMTIGAVYGVRLSGLASWRMQDSDPTVFDATESVSGNDLTYLGAPATITEDDTIATQCLGSTEVFSPRTASYDAANYNDVTLSDSFTIIINVKGITDSSTIQYLLGSSGSAFIYYQGSIGRLRISSDIGEVKNITTSILTDGLDHEITVEYEPNRTDVLIDDQFIASVSGDITGFTTNCIGARDNTGSLSMDLGAVYGVDLGSFAIWRMQSNDPTVFDDTESVSGNDLTYLGAPATITEADTIETEPLPDTRCYSPKTSSYTVASFDEIAIPVAGTITINVRGINDSGFINYLMGSDGSAYIYYRGSDGRLRINSDSGNIRQITTFALIDQDDHELVIVFTDSRVDFFVDGEDVGSATGEFIGFSPSCIGAKTASGANSMVIGAVYGVNVNNVAAWRMQSASTTAFEGKDQIGSNDLVYVDAPDPITPSDTTETRCLD